MVMILSGGIGMKKLWILVITALLLCGCGAEETFETVGDEMLQPVIAQQRQILLQLPEETLLPAMESEGRTLYLCKDFDVTVQTLDGGDLDGTVRQVSGFSADDLTVLQTVSGEYVCYEFVWTAAGDLGEEVCRAKIIDDGSYHYVLTASAAAARAGELQEIWNGMFETFELA
jgi:hypothetical protein